MFSGGREGESMASAKSEEQIGGARGAVSDERRAEMSAAERGLREAFEAATACGAALAAETRRLEEALIGERQKVKDWSTIASDVVNAVVLSPHRTVKFADIAKTLLAETMSGLDFIERLRWIHCSFPAAAGNAPEIELDCLENKCSSVWKVRWRPVWSVDIYVDLAFNLLKSSILLRLSHMELVGRLRLEPSPDCAIVRASFLETPEVNLVVSTTLNFGGGSVALRELSLFETRVKDEFIRWLEATMVFPKSHVVFVDELNRDKRPLSDSDLQHAMQAAADAAARNRDDFGGGFSPVC